MSISNYNQLFKELKKHPENFYIIHYSCQSLNDDNEGLSPRITSIGITHYSTQQTVSFSTHAIAEEMKITKEEVVKNFDKIEHKLLKDFYMFVRDRRDKYWLHWNMRNLTYGFEHLEHRYRALEGNDASVIPVERRININDILSEKYGSKYAPHPKMKNLMEINGDVHRHFLTGEEELQAFQNAEYIRMHNSTLCKLGFFHIALQKASKGKLKTISKGFGVMIDRIFESRTTKLIALVSSIFGIMVFLYEIYSWMRSWQA